MATNVARVDPGLGAQSYREGEMTRCPRAPSDRRSGVIIVVAPIPAQRASMHSAATTKADRDLIHATGSPDVLAPSNNLVASVKSLISVSDTTVQGAAVARSDSLTEVDAIIVGGGFSGLASAYDLHRAGITVAVLEAKETLGGRSRSVKRKSGAGIIELGATWINNITQPDVFKLTQEFGLETAAQYTEGLTVFQGVDKRILQLPADSVVTTDDPEVAELEGQLLMLLDGRANATSIRKFDEFPKDEDVTVAQWVAEAGFWDHPHLKATVGSLTRILVGREPEEIGAHYFFDYIKSGGGLADLGSEGKTGAQSLKIKEGTTAIVTSLANALPSGSVHVKTPVQTITQKNGTILVTTGTDKVFKAKKLILAIPSNTYDDIKFSPSLPCKKNKLVSSTKPGIYAKLILSYSEAWWRAAGLSGKFSSSDGPICLGWDTSDPSLSQYSLALFVAGKIATEWHDLPDLEKKQAVTEHLAEMVGDDLAGKARDTLEINYIEWTKEDYLDGAPTSSMGPGLLRNYGTALREPFGDIYFSGGETAYEWKGYLEGAVRAGKRAAKEAIEAFEAGKK
ncbi:putative flavin-containing monoamine oxidase A [Paramyrothecium foliicola]|nr:putative flavin-containing monoamine oxidase A [Paramyrothecium foliicola]